jgi:CDP-glycerol glycerophosphotransferase (TagB/SpsB family)
MKNLLLLVLYPFSKLFSLLCSAIRRDPALWVFGSYSNTFTDNAKYVYTHIVDAHPEIRAVWISANPEVIGKLKAAGGEAYSRWSVRGLYLSARAKYWFINSYVSDINYYTSRGAIVFNLWHGVPVKKIEYDIERGPLRALFHTTSTLTREVYTPATFRRPDYVLSTSAHVSETRFSSAFRIPRERCVELGYPRLAPFTWDENYLHQWVKRWGQARQLEPIEAGKKYRERFIYMPTWRDNNPDFLGEHFDAERINDVLVRLNSILYLKLHFSTPNEIVEQFRGFSNLYVLNSEEDVYPLLKYTDLLITDYSSIYYDYLLLDKEICFYAFDLEEYERDIRGLYEDYRGSVPGFIAADQRALLVYLETRGSRSFEKIRGELRPLLHSHVEGNAAERIAKYVVEQENPEK